MSRQTDALINNLIDGIGREILRRGTDNLSSVDFSLRAPMSAKDNYSDFKDKTKPHQWSITNTGVTAKTGDFHQDKKKKEGEVIWDCPWSYELNFGTGPHTMPFDKLYEWAWKRQKEIQLMEGFGSWAVPDDREYWTQYLRYQTPTQANRKPSLRTRGSKKTRGGVEEVSFERKFKEQLFIFTFRVWKAIQRKGTQPTFFASDAVVTTVHDLPDIIKAAVSRTKGVKLV